MRRCRKQDGRHYKLTECRRSHGYHTRRGKAWRHSALPHTVYDVLRLDPRDAMAFKMARDLSFG